VLIPKAHLWFCFHDAIKRLHEQYSDRFQEGQMVRLRASAWYDPESDKLTNCKLKLPVTRLGLPEIATPEEEKEAPFPTPPLPEEVEEKQAKAPDEVLLRRLKKLAAEARLEEETDEVLLRRLKKLAAEARLKEETDEVLLERLRQLAIVKKSEAERFEMFKTCPWTCEDCDKWEKDELKVEKPAWAVKNKHWACRDLAKNWEKEKVWEHLQKRPYFWGSWKRMVYMLHLAESPEGGRKGAFDYLYNTNKDQAWFEAWLKPQT
jgi:uncharacterized protein YihD (DUF1040 family)